MLGSRCSVFIMKPVDVAEVAGGAVAEVEIRFQQKAVELTAETMTGVVVDGNSCREMRCV